MDRPPDIIAFHGPITQANADAIERVWDAECYRRWKEIHDRTGIDVDLETPGRSAELVAESMRVESMRYSQEDYNIALGLGLLAGACIGVCIGIVLCAILVRVLGI
jgi:hypothetical protein